MLAGELVMRRAAERKAPILPVDSEHSAIFQSLVGHNRAEVRRLILTASGGPLRAVPADRLPPVTPGRGAAPPQLDHGRQDHHRLGHPDEQGARGDRGPLALRRRRPAASTSSFTRSRSCTRWWSTWTARWWPSSGVSDMRGPISYALSHPEPARRSTCRRSTWPGWAGSPSRRPTRPASRPSRSPTGRSRWAGTAPAVLSGADEAVVEAFLAGRCSFDAIARVCAEVLDAHRAERLDVGRAGHRRLRLGQGRGGCGGWARTRPDRESSCAPAVVGLRPGLSRASKTPWPATSSSRSAPSSSSSGGSSSSTSSATSSWPSCSA